MKFVFIMGLVAIIGFFCVIKKMKELDYEPLGFLSNFFSCIVIAVPPGLPAAASCGLLFALNRLEKLNIFCISPPKVNSAGRITRFVFDKTGTITEEGLTVYGYQHIVNDSTVEFDDITLNIQQNIQTTTNEPINTTENIGGVFIRKITSRKSDQANEVNQLP